MSLFFVFPLSLFFFSVVSPHISLIPLAILLLLPSFMLFSALVLPYFCFAVLFVAAAAVFAFFFDFLKHSGTPPSTL